ncbi:3-oxoacyl-ACP synthase [Nannocystis radixulma]|uniref:3-oxoacyl-ACP synthase n=1 Tax=Nannocystis radixulma TaxID=2995305 RepID=A0ABT5B228_9BACT|nr:3-oxoacyl-ACP synthase [Nannocystis radixulma]MDC0668162.1 3-oxoacyl-ACP synthase [Nannocystis radixulma]
MMRVVSVGMCTPLGLTWKASVAEMRAGTRRIVETQVELAPDEPLRACLLPLLPPHLDRAERMSGLGVTALTEALGVVDRPLAPRLPLVLACPRADEGGPVDVPALVGALQREVPRSAAIELTIADIVREGRAGFFAALVRAEEMLRARATPWVLVGALDSLCDLGSLVALARSNRVLGEDNIDGLLPGEGAAFLLLTGDGALRQSGPVYGRIIAAATGREPRPYRQRELPSLAAGLTQVLARLRELVGPAAGRVDQALSCQPGEVFWTRELVQGYLRHVQMFPEPFEVTSITESLGDAGAASGALLVARALAPASRAEERRGAAIRSLAYGCSDAGEVGACIVEANPA